MNRISAYRYAPRPGYIPGTEAHRRKAALRLILK